MSWVIPDILQGNEDNNRTEWQVGTDWDRRGRLQSQAFGEQLQSLILRFVRALKLSVGAGLNWCKP